MPVTDIDAMLGRLYPEEYPQINAFSDQLASLLNLVKGPYPFME